MLVVERQLELSKTKTKVSRGHLGAGMGSVCGFSHVDFNGRERKKLTKDKVGSMSIQSSNSRLSRGILQLERDQMEYHQNGNWIQSLRSDRLGWRNMSKNIGI